MLLHWTDAQIRKAKTILKQHPVESFQEALEAIAEATGRDVTADALRNVFTRKGFGPPTSHCKNSPKKGAITKTKVSPKAPATSGTPNVQRLLAVIKRGPINFGALCDKLDLSPVKTKAVIQEARAQGIEVHIEHDHVGIVPPARDERVQDLKIAPLVGERQKIAVISDTHLGSKYCLREQLKDFIHYAYSQGVREIVHPGDVLDGQYRHGIFEVSHTGLEDQTRDLFETLPQLPGLTYHGITGNHDFTFTEACGVEVGHFITNYFRDRGRTDFKFYGNRSAFLKIRGVLLHLWHPRSGVSYARSYGIQKQIEKYSSIKPQIMLAGHWHVHCTVFERGIHALACPTFQGGGSAFSKSLGGAPAIGGMILSWDLTTHGTIRNFGHQYRAYFEVEKPVIVENVLDATPIKDKP